MFRKFKTTGFKRAFFISTALTAVFFWGGGPADAATYNVNSKVLANDSAYGLSNGRITGNTYNLQSGTWRYPTTGTPYNSFPNGIYQNAPGGITISNVTEIPTLNFNGGVLWDYSAYVPSLSAGQTATLNNGESAGMYEISGDIAINSGYFNGRIDIRKGNNQLTYITTDLQGNIVEKIVLSRGDINISGGNFYFNGGAGKITMVGNNTGSYNISGGTFWAGYTRDSSTDLGVSASAVTATIGDTGHNMTVTGGSFHINAGSVLQLTAGENLRIEAPANTFSLEGSGTLSLGAAANGAIDINSTILWNDGTLQLTSGTMNINANIVVNEFKSTGGGAINLNSILSIKSDLNIGGTILEGSGELRLEETANATFGKLTNFGTVSIGRGSATFTDANSFSVLNVGFGKAYINAQTTIGTLNMNNGVLFLKEELIISSLNFDSGKIIFTNTGKPLTLNASSTIYNTSSLITEVSSADPDTTGATAGQVTVKDGNVLTFADAEGSSPGQHFSSGRLTVLVENGASADFNAAQVSFNTLKMSQGTANFNTGTVNLNTITLGEISSSSGFMNVLAGAAVNASEIDAYYGSKINLNGSLTVGELNMIGSVSSYATMTGTGTLTITKSAQFDGLLDNLQNVVVSASANNAVATFNGETGRDSIKTLTLNSSASYTAKAVLTKGTLTLDYLKFNESGGEVDIQENAVLALSRSPDEFTGTSNINIYGNGTLKLLGSTNISFGSGSSGGVNYLGKLEIGTGTASITGDTTIGGVTFTDGTGGTLNIAASATLTLDKGGVFSHSGNTVSGAGTLDISTTTGASTFNGIVSNLGELNFGAQDIIFGYNGTSSINTLTASGSGNIIINGGTLGVTNNVDFETKTNKVSGTGTLVLNGMSNQIATGASLGGLKINQGNVKIYDTSEIGMLSFGLATAGSVTIEDGKELTITRQIDIGAGNSVSGGTLIISGSNAVANFGSSDLTSLLQINNGATANINADLNLTQNVQLNGGTTVNINAGKTLTLSNYSSSANDRITGAGTLVLNDGTLNAALDRIGNLKTSGTVYLTNTVNILSGMNVTSGVLTLQGHNTVGGQMTIGTAATVNVMENTTVTTVAFADTAGGLIDISSGKQLIVTQDITAMGANQIGPGTGAAGTIVLAGNATGHFGMTNAFAGGLEIGMGTAFVTYSTSFGSIKFSSSEGGTLDIAAGNTLSIGTIITNGKNKISGDGVLNLTGSGSEFHAPIGNLGELNISGNEETATGQKVTATFYNSVNINTLVFNGGGALMLEPNITMTVNNLYQGSGVGKISGGGNFVAGNGSVQLSTGGDYLNSATVGTGILNFIGDSYIGSLQYGSVDGTIDIAGNVTVSVGSDFSGIGVLKGLTTSSLYLQGNSNATFIRSDQFAGNIRADSGSLKFYSDTDFTSLTLASASAEFYRTSVINTLNVNNGKTTFNLAADVTNLNAGNGTVVFKDTSAIGAMNIDAGTVSFAKDSFVTNGLTVGTNGVLDIGTSKLTISGGSALFGNNSHLALKIGRNATDADGNVLGGGFGRLAVTGGTLDVRNNVLLDLTIEYGLVTADAGSVFQLVETNTAPLGSFSFQNNRYQLEEVTCQGSSGLCYSLIQTSTGAEVAGQENGSQNNVNTAGAFLDGELFEYGTKIFSVAEHLDALSQKTGQSKAYLNALTALAPDITGAMTRQPINMQAKINNTLSARMNGLMDIMGSSSSGYKEIQKLYGRSGGSPYKTRWMRSEDYYRRAGYIDDEPGPAQRPRPRPSSSYQYEGREADEVYTPAEKRAYAKKKSSYSQPKNFGLWAQAFYNKAEYMSSSDPEGFSGDTTGFAFGADVEFLDVFAVGAGYASTSTDVSSVQRSTDVNGDTFFLYGLYKPSDWFISSVLTYGSFKYDEQKNISGMMLSDNYNGKSLGAQIMYGWDMKAWTPAVGFRYSSVERDAHTDEIGQQISKISSTALTAVAETRWKTEFGKSERGIWSADVMGALTYDVSEPEEDAIVNLPNGSSYSVKGESLDPLGIELGGTVAYLLGEHIDISAGYNVEWKKDYWSHTLTATFRYSF